MKIYNKEQIATVINLERDFVELMNLQKKAFIDFSNGDVVVPTPLQLSFKNPIGDCHVKGGYRINDEFFVIKVVSGFYECSSGDGLVIVASQRTGKIEEILHDEGWLTQIRTALATCIAAELTPFDIDQIGIMGAGKQAEVCLQFLCKLYPSKKFLLWGRNSEKADLLVNKIKHGNVGMNVNVSKSDLELIEAVQLIVTATPSHEPFLLAKSIKSKKHIIALGSDEKGKQELDIYIFEKAGVILTDSRKQASEFGEIPYAMNAGLIKGDILELGEVIGKGLKDFNTNKIIITDLTGIAAQDVFIAQWIFEKLLQLS